LAKRACHEGRTLAAPLLLSSVYKVRPAWLEGRRVRQQAAEKVNSDARPRPRRLKPKETRNKLQKQNSRFLDFAKLPVKTGNFASLEMTD
jgi:hypothetical protein